MTLASELAGIALEAAASPPEDLLRAYLLANLVVAAGASPSEPLLAAVNLAVGATTSGWTAHQLACRMHFRTQDDFDPGGRVHVGAVVIPAVLAVGSPCVLRPIAAGYRVLTCVARAYRDEAEVRGLRPTGVFGPIGAAAAAGVAVGLDARRLATALELSTSMSAGTNQSWVDGSDEWLLEVGAASRAGVEAALFARAGLRGADRAFEGRAGWGRAFFGDEAAASLAKQVRHGDLGLDRVAVKRYPVSGIAQVPTALSAEIGRRLKAVTPQTFEIRLRPGELAYPGSANRGPRFTRSTSLMSVARCATLAYLHGVVPLASLSANPGPDEEAILRTIGLVPDPGRPEGSAEVTVVAKGRKEALVGDGEEMLHPTWRALSEDVEGLASRCEAPVATARKLRAAVAEGIDAQGIAAVLDGPTGSAMRTTT